MGIEIRETNLRFTTRLRPRRTTIQIVIHHTVSGDVSAEEIHRWHTAKQNWGGIGYHYVIRQNGQIERGRPEHMIGVHTKGANTNSIAIALTGDFSLRRPPIAQIDSLVNLVRDIRGRFQSSLAILRHSDLSPTACPGGHFPWATFLNKIGGK